MPFSKAEFISRIRNQIRQYESIKLLVASLAESNVHATYTFNHSPDSATCAPCM